jgi:hypothetical protein
MLVVSRHGEWPTADPSDHCHYCDSAFIFEAYEWNAMKRSFDLIRTFGSQKQHDGGFEALEAEWPYIQTILKK